MLDWFTGAVRSQATPTGLSFSSHYDTSFANPTSDQEIVCLQEPPETPAPLFAVRAFKTAIFGTPGPTNRTANDDKRSAGIQQKEEEDAAAANMDGGGLQDSGVLGVDLAKSKVDMFASPAKGILVTPGTVNTRQKSVSFDPLAKMEQRRVERSAEDVVVSNISNESPSSSLTAKSIRSKQNRSMSLKRKLFEGRTDEVEIATASNPTRSHHTQTSFSSPDQESTRTDEIKDVDITVDLNEPRSRSGKHWKDVYSEYHNKSDVEMRNLIKYSQSARSYAAARDDVALHLDSKLRKALDQLAESESKVSRLAARLAEASKSGQENSLDQEETLTQLVAQTSRALQSKQKAEMYEAAIRKKSAISESKNPSRNHREGRADEVLAGMQKHHDPSDETSTSQSEVENLRFAVEEAETKATELEYQKGKLEENLIRAKKEMKSFAIRYNAREESRKETDRKHKDVRRKLEVELSQCRAQREAETMKFIEENQAQAKELDRLRNALNREGKEFLVQEGPHEILIEDLKQQIKDLQEEAQNLRPDVLQQHQRRMSQELRSVREELRRSQLENEDLKCQLNFTAKKKFQAQYTPNQKAFSTDGIDIWTDINEPTNLLEDVLASPGVNNRTKSATRFPSGTPQVLTDIDQNNTKQQSHITDEKSVRDPPYKAQFSRTSPSKATDSLALPHVQPDRFTSSSLDLDNALSNAPLLRPSISPSRTSKRLPLRSYSTLETVVSRSLETPSKIQRIPQRRITNTLDSSHRASSLARVKSRSALDSLPAERRASAIARIQENREARRHKHGRGR